MELELISNDTKGNPSQYELCQAQANLTANQVRQGIGEKLEVILSAHRMILPADFVAEIWDFRNILALPELKVEG